MSAPAGVRTSAELAARASLTESLVDRGDEAVGIAQFILGADSRLVVLHGAADSGKTELVRRWVLPALRDRVGPGRDVFYGQCAPGLPGVLGGGDEGGGDLRPLAGALSAGAIVLLDNFERVFGLPRDEKRAELDRLFELRGWDGAERAVLVLVTDSVQLNSVYGLTSYDPRAASAVRELHAMTADEALARLGQSDPDARLEYSEEMLKSVSADCAQLGALGWSDTFDLVKLVHSRALALHEHTGRTEIYEQDYDAMGGARGILRLYLEARLDALDTARSGDADIARAILERLREVGKTATPGALAELGPRVGVEQAEVDRVAALMTESAGLLRRKASGTVRVVPPQLLVVIEEDLAPRKRPLERAARAVADGLTDWRRFGILLSHERFEAVHAQRRYLNLGEDEVRFLLQCALLHDDASAVATRYWLRRVRSAEERLNVVLRSLLHEDAAVRRRAAALLADHPQPDVADRLCTVALSDPDAAVRAAAVTSLEPMKSAEVKARFLREVESPPSSGAAPSPFRIPAMDALRIFPDAEVARVLKRQVDDPASELSLRERAVGVLAALGVPQSVDALLDIALDDADEEDRSAAAKALATTQSEELNRRIFRRLGAARGRRRLLRAVALGAITVVALLLWPILTVVMMLLTAGEIVVLVLLGVALLTIGPTVRRMGALWDQRMRLASPLGILTVLMYAMNALTWFAVLHGLAHLAAKKPRLAALLLGAELFGLMLYYIVGPVLDVYPRFAWAGPVYQFVGVALFAGSYLYDVVGVLYGETTTQTRRRLIYERVFGNPDAARLVLQSVDVGGAKAGAIPSAERLLKKYGEQVPQDVLLAQAVAGGPRARKLASDALIRTKGHQSVQELARLWREGDAPTREQRRRTIARILAKRPDQNSLEVLDRIRPDMGRRQRLQVGWARLVYKLRLWPRTVLGAVVVLLPAVVVLLVTGWKVERNPGYPQLVALQTDRNITATQKTKIVEFLADVYPDESVGPLFTLLARTKGQLADPVHEAMARALATITARPPADSGEQAMRQRELLGAAAGYDSLLASAGAVDDERRVRALRVLETMMYAMDTEVSDSAIHHLASYVTSAAGDAESDSLPRLAVAALGRLPYDRSVRLLDSLLTTLAGDQTGRRHGRAADDLQEELEAVSARMFNAARSPDSALVRRGVKAALAGLARGNQTLAIKRRRAALDSLDVLDDTPGRSCDRNHDSVCDDRDKALDFIADNPSLEFGYTDLVNHYVERNDYRGAVTQLERLKRQYPDEVWPRQSLASFLHEYVAPRDTSAFVAGYLEMRGVRTLPAYATLRDSAPDDYSRLEANFVEIALSARRYGETVALAERQLDGPARATDPTYRLNAALFAYMAEVMAGRRAAADARLTRLTQLADSLPPGFYNNWAYPGTLAFLVRSGLPPRLRGAMLRLCRPGAWYEPAAAAALVAENRRALESLGR